MTKYFFLRSSNILQSFKSFYILRSKVITALMILPSIPEFYLISVSFSVSVKFSWLLQQRVFIYWKCYINIICTLLVIFAFFNINFTSFNIVKINGDIGALILDRVSLVLHIKQKFVSCFRFCFRFTCFTT